jgi:AcrR family transcriptional regulator
MDRIVEPLNQRSRDTRAAILDSAGRLLETRGGAALTMSAVAKAAGVTRRGLYLHFTSRGQLFEALIEHINQRFDLAASIRPVTEARDALGALDAWAAHGASFHTRLVPLARAVNRVRADDVDAERLWQTAMYGWYEACQGLAGKLAKEGKLALPWTPGTAADLLWALMSVEFVNDLVGVRGWTVPQLAKRLSLLLRRTLAADA